jgi:hypothetical protein
MTSLLAIIALLVQLSWRLWLVRGILAAYIFL